jgi:predicted transcriptional regulator
MAARQSPSPRLHPEQAIQSTLKLAMISDDEHPEERSSYGCWVRKTVKRVNDMQKKELPGLYIQSPKLNQLNILREVAADAHITQAELASRCSLSVAMVNNYMKELCKTGLMEYHRRSIKSVTYHLTPSGVQHVELLQLELISEMVGMFAASKEQIWARIVSQAPAALKRVVLFGSGHLAQLVFHALELAGVHIMGICDDDMDRIGGDFCGRQVQSTEQIRVLAPDAVIVARPPEMEETSRSLDFIAEGGITVIRLDCNPFTGSGLPSEATSSPIHSGKTVQPSISLQGNR